MPRLRKKNASSKNSSSRSRSYLALIAIIIFALLTIAGIYIYSSDKTNLMEQINSLVIENEILSIEKTLLEEMDDVTNFYYATQENGLYQIRSLDSNGNDSLVYESDNTNDILMVYAQPRVGFDGTVFIQRLSIGDDPSFHIQILDTNTGQVSESDLNSQLPHVNATKLSPDERLVAAVYDNPEINLDSLELKVWSLQDESVRTLATLPKYESFVSAYDGIGGAYGEYINWTSTTCVAVLIYNKEINKQNTEKELREYCI